MQVRCEEGCAGEGKPIPVVSGQPECCSGLELIPPKEESVLGISGFCTAKCGDGTCDFLGVESAYNCPHDCSFGKMQACANDSDCILVDKDCCSCNHGGERVSINKAFAEQYEEGVLDVCKVVSVACPPVISDDPSCSVEAVPVCTGGICGFEVPAPGTCGDGVCQGVACTAIGCPQPETPENCPEDCPLGQNAYP